MLFVKQNQTSMPSDHQTTTKWSENLLCRCSNRVPFGAYSKTIILVKGFCSSQNPIRFTKFLWFIFDNLSICKKNERGKPKLCYWQTEYKLYQVDQIWVLHALFLNWVSKFFDQSSADFTAVDVTAISTPLDRVPLYTVPSDKEPIILLKSSQAVTSSDRWSFGTPRMQTLKHEYI